MFVFWEENRTNQRFLLVQFKSQVILAMAARKALSVVVAVPVK